MTIDEIIKSLEIIVANNSIGLESKQEVIEEAIIKLKELKIIRQWKSDIEDTREKTIDEFTKRLKQDPMAITFGLRCCDIDRISEEMKGV